MATINEHVGMFRAWFAQQNRESRWCILISADPDALASAMALKRILRQRSTQVTIARINPVTRPDNLAMIRYLRIGHVQWNPAMADAYTHFALVDSQPSHSKILGDYTYDLIIDHHPLSDITSNVRDTSFIAIRPGMGATSSFMARLLRGLGVRPGPLLATALLYGIRTDTGAFERSGGEEDLRAYQWLTRFANNNLLRRISRSEYLREWLPLFARAFRSLKDCRGSGAYAALSDVKEADMLVSMADFFTKVHGLRWIAVSGVVDKQVIVIFRGDGSRDMGRLARECFGEEGEAGGHRNLARAQFPVAVVPSGEKPTDFVYRKLMAFRQRSRQAI